MAVVGHHGSSGEGVVDPGVAVDGAAITVACLRIADGDDQAGIGVDNDLVGPALPHCASARSGLNWPGCKPVNGTIYSDRDSEIAASEHDHRSLVLIDHRVTRQPFGSFRSS